ncbi:hypothetical protein L202_03300 [Cryptococcus amylolentus CBS 6039]|uniref:RRM Nup35-type domain-containing protein n=2 Tax=Cryptococcus amylolentus TaxID=104669 RepID=A0A1E3HSF3_9TREE|nr:hypothetical protein L202_03300 [Cryptococcus amylolentus CBS 6039]ODN79288.1 hypothetical protein L202_03300 [Cryptococcus amylolentus CBS 6039]ODO07692.1 hypothetical protein I350_03264 [Cryptococcus amylolentus CBS 6273]
MSNDWWSTPSRTAPTPNLTRSQSLRQSRYAPTAGDELDPEDAKAADAIKFLPSFASSQAGKMTLGTSPTGGMSTYGGYVGSPQGERRSPQGRLSGSVHEANSPRHTTRARTLAHQSSVLGSSYNPNAMDEDMPPTASLRDSVTDTRSAPVLATNELPTPPSLIPTRTTTSLYIFGPPSAILSTLEPYLAQFGTVQSYHPGPEGSNWYIVEFATPLAASYALRRHGDIIQGKWMIGFKVGNGGSMEGFNAGAAAEGGEAVVVPPPAAGTPIRVQNASILRPKPVPQAVVKAAKSGNEYAWDEPEGQPGWTGWVTERLFGR